MKPETPWASAINPTQHTQILSASYLHHVNQQKLRHISHLQRTVEQGRIAGLSAMGVILIVAYNYVLLRRMAMNTRKISITNSVKVAIKNAATRTVDVPHLEGEEFSYLHIHTGWLHLSNQMLYTSR